MDRNDLQQLSKEQLIELVLALHRPDKNSRTSSKPPSTDKKEKRENWSAAIFVRYFGTGIQPQFPSGSVAARWNRVPASGRAGR
jgi:hypothetical protein